MGLCKDPPDRIETIKTVRTVIRSEELALAATSVALKQAGWNPPCTPSLLKEGSGESGIIFGIDNAIDNCKTEFFEGLLNDGPIGASPLLFPFTSSNAITAQITIAFGIKGEDITITDGPLSFLKAIDYSLELLNRRVIISAIVGGVSENEAMVLVVEHIDIKEEKNRFVLAEIMKHKNSLLASNIALKSIEDSFRIVEDFLKGRGMNRAGVARAAIDKKIS